MYLALIGARLAPRSAGIQEPAAAVLLEAYTEDSSSPTSIEHHVSMFRVVVWSVCIALSHFGTDALTTPYIICAVSSNVDG